MTRPDVLRSPTLRPLLVPSSLPPSFPALILTSSATLTPLCFPAAITRLSVPGRRVVAL
jgi:hypothetical protein